MSISSLLVRGLKKGRWVWNEHNNDLQFTSLVQERKQRKQKEIKSSSAINGLTYIALHVDLKFKSTVSELQLMEFRHFLKKLNHGRSDTIVTIQDCKIVAIFLCIQRLPVLFHKFYNLQSVNQLLRACLVYMQFYLLTCENIVKTQHFLRSTPTPYGKCSGYQALKEDLDDLRVMIGRFYAGIVLGELNAPGMSKTDEIVIFECFLRVSTVVVWIALERKYLTIIKIELERIFRTGYFNNFNKNDPGNILHSIKKENHKILNGKIDDVDKRRTKVPNRLNSCSPVIHNFIRIDEPKLILLGSKESKALKNDRLRFLTEYIFLPETEIQDKGVKIGILGLQRRLFDPLLYPCPKRILKLLITSSPMDISEDRNKLRENAAKKAQREGESQSPHIFDDLPKIPRPNQFTENIAVKVFEKEKESEVAEEEEEEEEEDDLEFFQGFALGDDDDDYEEENEDEDELDEEDNVEEEN